MTLPRSSIAVERSDQLRLTAGGTHVDENGNKAARLSIWSAEGDFHNSTQGD